MKVMLNVQRSSTPHATLRIKTEIQASLRIDSNILQLERNILKFCFFSCGKSDDKT